VDVQNSRNIVGPQVTQIRVSKGWSQEHFATVCQLSGWDISRGVVARIEGGVRWVADFEVLLLAKALRVSVPELYPPKDRKAFLSTNGK
jgi:transcriptional regulator with XRE-family HTH domain